jgi:3-hydroxyisobutyrate dehydrogenase
VFMNAALGNMMSLKVRLPATYLRGNFEARFALNLARKDLGLATELGRTYNIPMRMATLCEQEMIEGISRGWGGQDSSIILTLQEERAQTQVRLPPSSSGQA